MRLLITERGRASLGRRLEGLGITCVAPGEDADIAFVSRDVTGLSTKHQVTEETQLFYDGLLGAPSLRWVHVHSAGTDRPVYVELHRRGVALSTSSGSNAPIVAQTALAGILALARGLPGSMAAQREHRWTSPMKDGLPRDLEGQTALVLGWGPIGQRIGELLDVLGLQVIAARSHGADSAPARTTITFEQIRDWLPRTDWLVLACPLSDRTRRLIDDAAFAALPPGARLVNVARGEVVDEPAMIRALQGGQLDGAFLDVYAHEPLAADSPLWDMPNVICTPHSAGMSDGNEKRVASMFIENLERYLRGEPLERLVS